MDNKVDLKQVAMQQLLSSEGWDYLLEELESELNFLDRIADKDPSEEVGNSCMRKRIGIKYVISRANDMAN